MELADWAASDYEEFMGWVNEIDETQGGYGAVIDGYCDLWTGKEPAGQLFTSLRVAVEAAVYSGRVNDVSFLQRPGGNTVYLGAHPDGTNEFTIRLITKRGRAWIDAEYSSINSAKSDRKAVIGYLLQRRGYTKLIHWPNE